MSSWDQKLGKRLSALTDTASKESLQTLAKWMSFNRKHADAFCSCISGAMEKTSDAREWLYWQLIHQTLIMEKDNPTKWDRLEDLRMKLGEKIVLPFIQKINPKVLLKVKPLVQEWDEMNVFGATMHNQIKRASISSQEQPKQKPKQSPLPQTISPPPTTETTTEPQKPNTQPVQQPIKPAQEQSEQPEPDTKTKEEDEHKRISVVNVDFDKETIPEGRVEPREFADPVKLVATLQITRDLRSDSAVQYPALMNSIPLHIRKICQQYLTQEGSELEESEIQEYSLKLPTAVLDLDVEEAIDNVRTFREILKKLKSSRDRLLYLLIKSRCKFGSSEAAEAFFRLEDLETHLKTRKELLTDAMDLEGMEIDRSKEITSRHFERFSWYDQNGTEREPKRQKL